MIIASAHLQMMSNQCTDFQKNPCTHLLDHRGQNHVHRRVTDGQTDEQGETNIPPTQTYTSFAMQYCHKVLNGEHIYLFIDFR